MKPAAEPLRRSGTPSSLAIDNLRAIVILAVLLFHSVLAYLNFLPAGPFPFDAPPFAWRSVPIIDHQRWFGFDLFCAWLDVFLMSFFFLLSGLFAWPSLTRKGAQSFVTDRVLRLGAPFAAVVLLLMPLAHYPSYLQSVAEPGFAAYWRHWTALPLWPSGPMWFLWLLLVGDVAAAGLHHLLGRQGEVMLRLSDYARRRPARFLAGFVVAGSLVYIPLALVFGPGAWGQLGPFSLQLSRPGHYALYFFAGVAIGACGIERGLLAPDASLARRWLPWLAGALLSFLVWIALTALTLNNAAAPLWLHAAAALSFVLACFASCFFVLGLAVRFARVRSRWLAALSQDAYGMYLIHYVFIVWLQFALLAADLSAILKAAVVFSLTLLLSWTASAALRRVPPVAQVIGTGRRQPAARLDIAPPPRGRGASLAD
jgi:peptidoglycan/LPS O-acetylase OafA/YrhL